MSDRWRTIKAWEDQHLTGPWVVLKWLSRVFSSITLAVILLILVALYGISASVPVGMLVQGITVLLYGAILLAIVAVVAGGPSWLLFRAMKSAGRAVRFAATFFLAVGLAVFAGWLWKAYVWPELHYDPATGKGLLLFADFVKEYRTVTLRRLPGLEMSELEYYSWWPLHVILLVFVVNMVVATVMRIDFHFKNLGVITVHTGIVVIALGSIWYAGLKREGDTVLFLGAVDEASGVAKPGEPVDIFYDNTDVALWVSQGRGWGMRPLKGVPRYNAYNLGAIVGESAADAAKLARPWNIQPNRQLSIPVDTRPESGGTSFVDGDIAMRIVGYAPYAEIREDWVRRTPQDRGGLWNGEPNPLRIVYMHSNLPDDEGVRSPEKPIFAFTLPPLMKAQRWTGNGVFAVEYTMGEKGGMPAERWQDLKEVLPPGTEHAVVVEVPRKDGTKFRQTYRVGPGSLVEVGDTGWIIQVKDIQPEPPFPIITKGYEGGTSSVAVLKLVPPEGTPETGPGKGKPFERYVYHRYPEISQDMLGELNANGMPKRQNADPAIRVSLIEADQLLIYLDEPEGPNGPLRAIIRKTGGLVRVIDDIMNAEGLKPEDRGWLREVFPEIGFRVGERWDDSVKFERPNPIPPEKQEKNSIGNHDKAMVALEVSVQPKDAAGNPQGEQWKTVVWLPFVKYMGLGIPGERHVPLPDGRMLTLAFGRLQHRMPGFAVQMLDFEMLSYDHRGAPRDYQSELRVIPVDSDFEQYDHVTKLNEPLTAPFLWDDQKRGVLSNVFLKLRSGLSPFQFKLSQAGWDKSGWEQSQQKVDAGLAKRPVAKFTILGVGNAPGIHVIALGAILMGVGIPWAFYVKPALVKREKRKIQEQLKAGTYVRPTRNEAVGDSQAAGASS